MNCKKCELNSYREAHKIEKKHCKRCMSSYYIDEAEKYCEEKLFREKEKLSHPKEVVIDLTEAYKYSQINISAVKELRKFLDRDKPLVSSIANSLTVKEMMSSPNIQKFNKVLDSELIISNLPEISCDIFNPKSGKSYKVTLNKCECPDFAIHRRPCKHMYRLAMALGISTLSIPYEKKI